MSDSNLEVILTPQLASDSEARMGREAQKVAAAFEREFKRALKLELPEIKDKDLESAARAAGRRFSQAFNRAVELRVNAPNDTRLADAAARAARKFSTEFNKSVNIRIPQADQGSVIASASAAASLWSTTFNAGINTHVPTPSSSGITASAVAAAQAYSVAFQTNVSINIPASALNNSNSASAAGASAGSKYGSEFERIVKMRTEKALRSLPPVTITANSTPLEQSIAAARTMIESLNNADFDLIDSTQAMADLTAVRASMEAVLDMPTLDIDTRVNVAGLVTQLRAAEAAVEKAGFVAGDGFGGNFETTVRKHMTKLAATLPKIEINASSTDVERTFASIRADAARLSHVRIGVDMDAKQFGAEKKRIEAELKLLLRDRHLDIDARLNAQAALAQIQAMDRSFDKLGGKKFDFSSLFAPISPMAAASAASVLFLGGAFVTLAAMAVPVIAVIAGGLGGLIPLAVAAGAGFGVLALAIAPIVKAFGEADQAQTKVESSAKAVARAQEQVAAASKRVAEAEDGVAKARKESSKASEQAHERTLKAEEDLARTISDNAKNEQKARKDVEKARLEAGEAAKTAAETVRKAEEDLADTLRSNAKAEKKARAEISKARKDAQEQAQSAAEAVRRAEQDLAETVQENLKSETSARERLAEVRESAKQATIAANQRIADSERNLMDAKRDVLAIDKEIADQRNKDKEDIQELGLRAKENAQDQLEASIQLQKAQAELSMARAEGDGSAVGAAQAKVSAAQLAVERAQMSASKIAAQKTALQKNGSKQLQSLEERRIQLLEKVKEAELAVGKANSEASKTTTENNKRIQQAVEALSSTIQGNARKQADAAKAVQAAKDAEAKATLSANERIAAAQETLNNLVAENARKQQDASRALQAARENETKTNEAANERVRAAQEALAAMAEENARKQRDASKSVSDARQNEADVAVAGQERIAAAQSRLAEAVSNLSKTHAEVAEAAKKSADEQAAAAGKSSPMVAAFVARLKEAGKAWAGVGEAAQTQLLPRLQAAMAQVQPLIAPLSSFAGKVGALFGGMAIKAANALTGPWWAQWGNDMGPRILDVLDKLGSAGGHAIEGIAGLAQAFMPLGQDMAGGLEGAAKSFADWAKSLKDSPAFHEFIAYVKENAPVVKDLLKNIFDALVNFGKGAAGPGSSLLSDFVGWLKKLSEADPQSISKWITDIGKAVKDTISFMKEWGPTILAVIAAFTALRVIMTIATAAQMAFNIAMSLNPATLIVAGIVAAIAALTLFFAKTELGQQIVQGFIEFMKIMGTAIHDLIMGLVNGFIGLVTGIGQFVTSGIGVLTGFISGLIGIGAQIATWIGQVVGFFIGTLLGGIQAAINGVVAVFSGLIGFLVGLGAQILGWVTGVIQYFSGLFVAGIQLAINLVQGIFSALIGFFTSIGQQILGWITGVGQYFSTIFVTGIQLGINLVKGIFSALLNFFTGLGGQIGAWATNTGNNLKNGLINGVQAVVGGVRNIFNQFWGVLTGFAAQVRGWVGGVIGSFGDLARGIGDRVSQAFTTVVERFSGVANKVRDLGSTLRDALASVPNKMVELYNATMEFIRPIVDLFGNLKGKVEGALKAMNPSNWKMPEIKIPGMADGGLVNLPAFAGGGLIPGPYKHARADNVLGVSSRGIPVARVNPNEFILPVRATAALARSFGPKFLEWLRTYDQHLGRKDFGSGSPTVALASGGFVPSRVSAATFGTVSLPTYASGGTVSMPDAGGAASAAAEIAALANIVSELTVSNKQLAERNIALSVQINQREFATAVSEATNYAARAGGR